MGLEHFKGLGSSNRGRPKKDEDDDREPHAEDPFTMDKDTEEYWQGVWDEYVEGDEPTGEEIMLMCKHTALLPRNVRRKLQEHGIHDFGLGPAITNVPNDITEDGESKEPASGSFSFSGDDEEEDKFSGLKQALNNVK